MIAVCCAWAGTVLGAYLIGKSGSGAGEGTRAVEQGARFEPRPGNPLSGLEGADSGTVERTEGQFSLSGRGESSDALLLMKSSLTNRNPVERMSSFMAALAMMGPDDFEPALDALREDLQSRENQREIGLLLYAWAEMDGASALGYLDELELGREGWSLYSSALSAWGGSDPVAAEQWALEKHAGKEGNDNWHMLGVIRGVVKDDVFNAARIAQEIGFGRARGEALGVVVDELFRQGDEVAMQWIESMGDEDERFLSGAASRVASEIARKDPAAAGDWVVGLNVPDKERAVGSVAYEWGRKSPEEAAAWAAGLEEPELRSRGMSSVVETWARRDVNAVGTWLGNQPASPELDAPVRSYAFMVRERDPGAAIAWANTITDEKVRGETVQRIGGEWLRRNPDEAKAFLQEQESLPEGLQRYLN